MPIVVSYEDVGNLGSAALNAGYQSSFGQNAAQARQAALSRQQADTHMMMNQAFTRQNMAQQADINAASQGRAQDFQAGQNEQERDVQREGLALRANEQGFSQNMERAHLQQGYDLQKAREGEAATNDARDFQNKVLYESLRQDHGTQAADEAMKRKFAYEAGIDQYKHQADRNRFAQAAVNSGQAQDMVEGGLLFDRNTVDKAAKLAAPTRGRGAAGDLLGTLSGDVVQNAILSLKSGDAGNFMSDLEGRTSMRELPYNQRISMSAMYAAASNPNETSDQQVFRSIQSAQAAGKQDLVVMLQRAYHDRVAFGNNQRTRAISGGPMPGMGGGAAPPGALPMGPRDPGQMSDEELLKELYGGGQ